MKSAEGSQFYEMKYSLIVFFESGASISKGVLQLREWLKLNVGKGGWMEDPPFTEFGRYLCDDVAADAKWVWEWAPTNYNDIDIKMSFVDYQDLIAFKLRWSDEYEME
jgi:hypothetical protein